MKSILTKNQTKTIVRETRSGNVIEVKLRYDDQCGNGHNSFSITADIFDRTERSREPYRVNSKGKKRYLGSFGCCHDEIEKHLPELKHLIKWHLMNSDGPLHYVANTLYHSRDRTHEGVEIGDPVAFNTRFKFVGFPITFKQHEKGFWDYLNNVGDFNNVEVVKIPYDGKDTYNFEPNYSLTGFIADSVDKKWYKSPFKSKREAVEFLEALRMHSFEFVKTPSSFCEPVEPNLEYARSSAIWPDATLEQLQNKELLESRTPSLCAEFKSVIEELGFTY